jgi:hypothetical protein
VVNDRRRAEPRDGAAGAPRVLIVGGFMTAPPNYFPLRRRLLARGAAGVDMAPIGPLDWLAAGAIGFGPLLAATGRAIGRSYRRAGRVPVLVVGHSGGGIVARLALAPEPYRGRHAAVAEKVGALVTLGTPHALAGMRGPLDHAGHHAGRFLDAVSPGAHFAPRTAYLSVGSRYLRPRPVTRLGPLDRVLALGHAALLGDTARDAVGDGMVPLSAVHLEGAEQLTFDDVSHGHVGHGWYGDASIVDRWWPLAVRLWRGALEAREHGDEAPTAAVEVPATAEGPTAGPSTRSG